MFHKDYLMGLDLACEVHRIYREQTNVAIKNRRLAVYYLQRGSLTNAFVSIKNWEYGDLNGIYRAQRFISETNELLHFFSTAQDAERQLKRFFENKLLDIRGGVKKDDKLEEQMDKMMLEKTEMTYNQNRRVLREVFSTGMHPTLESSAYNSDTETAKFDYKLESEEFNYYLVRNFDFGNFIVVPAMQSVYVYSQAFEINPELLINLGNAIEHIQDLSIQLRK